MDNETIGLERSPSPASGLHLKLVALKTKPRFYSSIKEGIECLDYEKESDLGGQVSQTQKSNATTITTTNSQLLRQPQQNNIQQTPHKQKKKTDSQLPEWSNLNWIHTTTKKFNYEVKSPLQKSILHDNQIAKETIIEIDFDDGTWRNMSKN